MMKKKQQKIEKAQQKPGRGKGRPTKFSPEMIRQVEILAIKGFDDKEIAKLYGVTEKTVNNWKKEYPDFFQSLKHGKEIADAAVERCLFERATGYSHPDTHISNYQGDITITDIIKHCPPDVTAQIFWLKNRNPGQWRDKHDR
jgi:hypothetical protein